MKSLFVCVNCAFAIENKEQEKHYEKCLDKSKQLEHYRYIKYGIMDHQKHDLVVVRGINAKVVNKT